MSWEDAPDWVLALPAINASLNGFATVLLMVGWFLIRQGRKRAHIRVMAAAFATSVLFLACYLTYHTALTHYTGSHGKPFAGTGGVRTLYFAILISHVLLAAIVPILAIVTIWRGWTRRYTGHRRLGRITLPIWLYVSVTGVIIYLMLYQWPIETT